MKRCRFFKQQESPEIPIDFASAYKGWFMQLGAVAGDTMAFVQDTDGRIYQTWPEYVKVENSPMDSLLQSILAELETKVARSRWPETRDFVIQQFTNYAGW